MIRLPGFDLDDGKQVGMVGEVALELSEGWERHLDSEPTPCTRLVGAAPKPFLLTARIEYEGMLSGIGAALGAEDVETGDEAFDEMFVVKASDENDVLGLLTPEVRAAFKATPDTLVLDYKDGLVTAKWEGHEEDRRLLNAVIDLVVALSVTSPPEEPIERTPRERRVTARSERRRRLRETRRG